MAAVLLPGRNELVLCPAAVCRIVEQHLRDACYGNRDGTGAICVEQVTVSSGEAAPTFRFQVTTETKESA